MKQYHNILKTILSKGTVKPGAREGMPGTLSLFGHQERFDLQEGFPLLTTKEINFRHIVVELLWFLRGDTNIKFLVDYGCNIWNEDAYNYYEKKYKESGTSFAKIEFHTFVQNIKELNYDSLKDWFDTGEDYTLGDCGHQYGKVWRNFGGKEYSISPSLPNEKSGVDQITSLIKRLLKSPESRRHVITAIDPVHDEELALYWCHALFQFNCRPIQYFEGDGIEYGQKGKFYRWVKKPYFESETLREQKFTSFKLESVDASSMEEIKNDSKFPTYYLDCHLYQRSADVFLGVPYNIASYALLIEIIARICNMIPGELIHSFGDVHIYDNHKEQVNTILGREPKPLPKLIFSESFYAHLLQWREGDMWTLPEMISTFLPNWFRLENYDPHPKIKAPLSTGMKK
jgi:thymidylate synthase